MSDANPYRTPDSDLAPGPTGPISSVSVSGLLHPTVRVGIFGALCALLMLWFGYDGWLNSDPEMVEHKTFNQVGFGLFLLPMMLFPGALRRVGAATRERRSNRSAVVVISPARDEIRVATMPWVWALWFSGLSLFVHKNPRVGALWLIGSFFTSGLIGLGLAFFIRGIIERSYSESGWDVL